MKKILSVLLTVVLACATMPLVGCNGNDEDANYTGNKTQLRVGVYDGGLGHVWLEKVARSFEEKFAQTSFREGEMGVRIRINPQKADMLIDKVTAAIEMNNDAEDVYFLCQFTGTPFIYKGYSRNITTMVTDKVYLENGELADMEYDATTHKLKLKAGAVAPTVSIADKMPETTRTGYYMTGLQNGFADGYYSLPFESSLSGLIYDHDLFEEEGWLNYDGIDGLPDTEEQFFDLLDRMVDAQVIPFTFSAFSHGYWGGLADAYIAQYEGFDVAELDYTFDGEYTFPAGTFDMSTQALRDKYTALGLTENADGTQTLQVNRNNAWMLSHTTGKKKWVEFMRRLCTPKYYDQKVYDANFTYLESPKNFILSELGKTGQKRIAMLYEGEWWENENRSQFNYTGGYGKRDFRFFPLPYIEGQKDPDMRSVGEYSRGVDLFINDKTTKGDVAEIFLQYVHSESALETFTMETGITRSYRYDLSDEQLAKVSKFGQNVYKIKMSGTSDVTVTTSRARLVGDPFWDEFQMGFGGYVQSSLEGEVNSYDVLQHPCRFFVNNAGVNGSPYVSAESFLEGTYKYYSEENWNRLLTAWESQR